MTSPLFDSAHPLTGNTAKVRVLHDVAQRLADRPDTRILDIGCIGPQPLDFWRPILAQHPDTRLTGLDVAGIDAGRAVVAREGWSRVALHDGTGYALDRLFAPASFDVVTATQVLEHVARLDRFMAQVATVAAKGADIFFTLDSAHWQPRYPLTKPRRAIGELRRKLAAMRGDETHYDLPWYEHEVRAACERAGLGVRTVRYYGLGPVKRWHNHAIPAPDQNRFMRAWFAVEEQANDAMAIQPDERRHFRVLYVHAVRH